MTEPCKKTGTLASHWVAGSRPDPTSYTCHKACRTCHAVTVQKAEWAERSCQRRHAYAHTAGLWVQDRVVWGGGGESEEFKHQAHATRRAHGHAPAVTRYSRPTSPTKWMFSGPVAAEELEGHAHATTTTTTTATTTASHMEPHNRRPRCAAPSVGTHVCWRESRGRRRQEPRPSTLRPAQRACTHTTTPCYPAQARKSHSTLRTSNCEGRRPQGAHQQAERARNHGVGATDVPQDMDPQKRLCLVYACQALRHNNGDIAQG